jgi:hypothetical protein
MATEATKPGVERSVNTKVYTSIEEVLSDYTNKDDFNTLIFYKGMVSVPIKLVSINGTDSFRFFDGEPSDRIRVLSMRPYIKRNFLLKTSTIIPIMEKWSNLGLNHREKMKKIVDFIRGGNYSWIANVFEGFDFVGASFRTVEGFSKKHLDGVASLINSLERDALSSFFEKAFKLVWEENIKYWISDANADSFDFDVGEEEKSFAEVAKRAEDFFRDPKSVAVYPTTSNLGEKLLAIFSRPGHEKVVDIKYGKIWDFIKTKYSPQDNRESLKLIEEERERYDKMGVLSLFPEIFYSNVEDDGEWYLSEVLSVLQSRPETMETGLILVGHGEVSEKYKDFEAFFLPFIATKARTALKLSEKALEYGSYDKLIGFKSKNYNPVIVAYENESSKKEKPKFQIFSFSYGPMIDIKSPGDEKEKYLYAPMVEHAFYSKGNKGLAKARRRFVENPEKLGIYIKKTEDMTFSEETAHREMKELLRKIIDLINLPSLSRTYTRQVVEVDLTERNKIIEMVDFVEEMLERDKGDLDKENQEIVLRGPEEVRGGDEIEERIVRDLCYLGEGERVYVKAIPKDFTKDEKNILRMGSIISGNLSIETSGTRNAFSDEGVKNLYDVIFATLKRLSTEDDERKEGLGLGSLLSFIRQVSEVSEEVGKAYRITVERYGNDEIFKKIKDPKIKLIKNSEKMTNFGIARVAKEVFPGLARRLEESNGPNITVIVDYSPRVELHLSPEECVDENEGEYDLETLIEEGCDPDKVGINSVLETAVIFLDFKEEGLRVASVNLVSIV